MDGAAHRYLLNGTVRYGTVQYETYNRYMRLSAEQSHRQAVLTPKPATPEPVQPPNREWGRETCLFVACTVQHVQHVQHVPGRNMEHGARARRAGAQARGASSVPAFKLLVSFSKGQRLPISPVCGIDSWSARDTPWA